MSPQIGSGREGMYDARVEGHVYNEIEGRNIYCIYSWTAQRRGTWGVWYEASQEEDLLFWDSLGLDLVNNKAEGGKPDTCSLLGSRLCLIYGDSSDEMKGVFERTDGHNSQAIHE